MLYDFLVLVLTVKKTYKTADEHATAKRIMNVIDIPTLILRDGACS